MFIIAASTVSVAAVLVTLHRVVGIKRILRHATLVDVAFTVGMTIMFAGTLTGMLVAVLAGLIMALVLSVGRVLMKFGDSTTASTDSEFDAQGNWIYNKAPYV
jgi:hypothetical protein